MDFSRFDRDQVVEHVNSEAGRAAMENITRADPDHGAGRPGRLPSPFRSLESGPVIAG